MQTIDYVISFGTEYWSGGSHAYFLSDRSIKKALGRYVFKACEAEALRSAAGCSVVASNEVLITVMHASKPPKRWKLA